MSQPPKTSGFCPQEFAKTYGIMLLLFVGFTARLFALQIDFRFDNDIRTFQLWAIRLFEHGLHNFYSPDFFSDYPPVYLFILYLLGALRAGVQALFGQNFWQVLYSPAFRFFTFLPAILADLGIGFVIYKMAAKKTSFTTALLFASAWLFNPAIILISGVWGQIESVFVLVLLFSLIFLRRKELLPAYVLFGIAVLTKPQALFLGPVYLYSAVEFWTTHVRISDIQNKASQRLEAGLMLAKYIGAGIGTMVLVSLPFGLSATVRQLWYGMGLYRHASVNASNFWAMLGQNWGALDNSLLGLDFSAWGIIIAVLIVAGAVVALHINRHRHNGRHFYLIVAAIFILIFAFSIRMHERYLFPGLVFLLIYCAENRGRREFILYWVFSAVFFINCLEVLRWANAGFDWALLDNSAIRVMGFVMVFAAVALILTVVNTLRGAQISEDEPFSGPDVPPDVPPRMRRRDFAYIGVLIIAYCVMAFVNLGDMRAPQTTWVSENGGEWVDFGDVRQVTRFQFLTGARTGIPFWLHASEDGVDWQHVFSGHSGDVFAWGDIEFDVYARFFSIGANPGLRLQEAAFRGATGEILHIYNSSPGAQNLFDEQELVPESRFFMNSTYFDEIYHPRTGYEFLHGLTVFETTHPPLGKVFMAASIRAFGMTPFAWRLPGTLFGIFMIPLIYAFARLLLKSNDFALFTAFIFTFDFMLFSHTRLATIDSFVTFFVLLMYFLMYIYTRGINKNSLRKSLFILLLCGVAMGLAIASKWQGIYGALGLPVLFFPALYRLFKRDMRQAKITFFACFGIFIGIPLVIYALSYIPFVRADQSDYNWFRVIWNNQTGMFRYHSYYVLGTTHHPFASPWWSWPLMLRPLFQYQTIISDTMRRGMSSLGNPAVWWFGIFAVGYAIFSLRKRLRHESDTVFLLIAVAVNFLPWVFVTRLTFIYHFFPSVPFVVLLIALFFKNLKKYRDVFCFAYAGIVIALFVLFFPVLSGMPVSLEFVTRYLRWLPGWFFV
ncbi:MAG: phospholipid carrier-dependent glycosyltransferase [Defluviitaleaceae bacterium]|nr:phospholipid carrier-dependent glycosyltransferase [Defluviitaleaceae bacterium]